MVVRETGWYCSACGGLAQEGLRLYDDGIFNTHSKRFGPWCCGCGRRAAFCSAFDPVVNAAAPTMNTSVVVLTGTCASGKSSVSYELSERFGFTQIDGDWVLAMMKEELGRKPDSSEAHDALLAMALGMVAIGRSVTVAHVVLPEHFGLYTTFFRERGVTHRLVVLMPSESVVLARNLERKCWPKTTPEYWVLKFRQDFLDGGDAVAPYFYDNSTETALQTATNLAAACCPGA